MPLGRRARPTSQEPRCGSGWTATEYRRPAEAATGYDCFHTLVHTLDPRVQGEQLSNRLLLKEGLERQGLENYDKEWWHFTFKPETYRDTYFDFPGDSSSLTG